MCRLAVVITLCATIFAAYPSKAQQLLERYQALLSDRDHFNSSGQRLTSAAAIIRQDRANYHRFGLRDAEDENDRFFANATNRAALEKLLERGRAEPGVISAIVNGTPIITVEVWRGNAGPFVNVTVIDHVERPETNEPPPTGSPKQDGRNESKTGTAFYVLEAGYLVTNDHVVEGCSQIDVMPAGGRENSAEVLARDKLNDLAILKTSANSAIVPALRAQARVGESVFAFGFPLTGILSTSGNFTTGTVTALSGPADDSRLVQISAPVQPGNSGGPLIDKYGNVVGVIVSKLNALNIAAATHDIPQNVNFAIKSSIVLNFLNANSLTPNASTKSRELTPEALADLARLFTVRVTCNLGG